MSEPNRVRKWLLELVEKHGGFGPSSGRRAPGWLLSRLDRVAEAYAGRLPHSASELMAFFEARPSELAELIERVRVGETRFFRDPEQWQALAAFLPSLCPGAARLRVLSAGCSTGEEAWTLAMLLDHDAERPFRVYGVDRSRQALEQARSGCYACEAAAHVPEPYLSRYFVREAGTLSIHDELRASVSFAKKDLLGGPPAGSFELIVCKNLLIYLSPEAGRKVLDTLSLALAEGGVLLLARAEIALAKDLGLSVQVLAPGVSVLGARG